MKDETKEWVELADQDRQMAELLLRESLYRGCIFHCQQALEKLLKAIWVEGAPEGYPPREHNLTKLAEKTNVQLSTDQLHYFDRLSKQYMPSRYADVAIEEEVEYSKEEADNYCRRMIAEFQWLEQKLT